MSLDNAGSLIDPVQTYRISQAASQPRLPMERSLPILTLTTDFGLKDGNVGVLKGVIWGICPGAEIADLSHLISPQNIAEAALILLRSAPFYPKGTVHVVVVDPGVGTARRPLAARLGDWFYVGPDNGTITMLVQRARQSGWNSEFHELNNSKYWLPEVSHVFHGRDIFAPSAAHLAAGVPLEALGPRIEDPILLDLPQPNRIQAGWRGEIIHIDHFGNLASNIRIEHLAAAFKDKGRIAVRLGQTKVLGMVDTFGERPVGEVVALLGSTGNLIISVVNGSAAEQLGARVGDAIEVDMPADVAGPGESASA